jgi:N-acetyl sugar amidotransferase
MDTASDPDIDFDGNGVCNHCARYDRLAKNVVVADDETKLNELVDQIKKSARGKRHDSILGISGGVDSTYVAYLAKQLGLKPLVVSVDNGWDDEIAQMNVRNAVEKLRFDFHHYVLDWNEFKDMQLAFLRASVVDIEMLTDHAILGALFRMANRHRVKHILSGSNVATEGGMLIKSWEHDKNDWTHIKAVHKKFGTVKPRSFPNLGLWRIAYYYGLKRIKYTSLLNYVRYVKDEAKQTLIREIGFQDYGGKHHESVFTRFYQTYILPRKFGFDKRRAHLSTLICSGQIAREEALKEMEQPPCSQERLQKDKEQVLEKLGLSEAEFEDIMNAPVRKHEDFKIGRVWTTLRSIHRWIREHRRA